MRKAVALLLTSWFAAYGLTVAMNAILSGLAFIPLDPVRFVAASVNDPVALRYHGKPVFSLGGAVIWLAVIVAYVLVVAAVCGRLSLSRWKSLTAVFAGSVAIVAFVHPLLVPVLLPGAWPAPYVCALEGIRLPVGAARIGYNIPVLFTAVSALQATLVFAFMRVLADDDRRNGRR